MCSIQEFEKLTKLKGKRLNKTQTNTEQQTAKGNVSYSHLPTAAKDIKHQTCSCTFFFQLQVILTCEESLPFKAGLYCLLVYFKLV